MCESELTIVAPFNPNTPANSGIVTQEMCDFVNPRIPQENIRNGSAFMSFLASIPISSGSNHRNREAYNRNVSEVSENNPTIQAFKERTKGRNLSLDVVFFIMTNFERRDIDNMLKPLLDAIKGNWFQDDGQITTITAHKFQVTERDITRNPQLYEQIYCCVTILD